MFVLTGRATQGWESTGLGVYILREQILFTRLDSEPDAFAPYTCSHSFLFRAVLTFCPPAHPLVGASIKEEGQQLCSPPPLHASTSRTTPGLAGALDHLCLPVVILNGRSTDFNEEATSLLSSVSKLSPSSFLTPMSNVLWLLIPFSLST